MFNVLSIQLCLNLLSCKYIYIYISICECQVATVMSDSLRPYRPQPARIFCPRRFPGQEYRSGLPCPPTGNLPDLGIKPEFLTYPVLAGRFFTTSATWEALFTHTHTPLAHISLNNVHYSNNKYQGPIYFHIFLLEETT